MDYADANFLVAVHFEVPGHTDLVERYLRRSTRPIVVGELAELECRNVFARLEGRAGGEAWQALVARLDSGGWRREPVIWESVVAKTRELIDRNAPRFSVGSLDTMHVAAAVAAGCSTFLSFHSQSNARVLAASARLKVWPELSGSEKGRLLR